MVTTSPETPTPSPYQEDDKLGPLGSRVSAIHDPVELRARLLAEFNASVQLARAAVASVDHGSEKAVHESRKALRRARSVLAMMKAALPKNERKAVRAALREARRSLSMIRDHSVAPETLGQLPLTDEDRETARRILDSAAEAIPPTSEIKQILGEAAARAAAQAEALEAALPAELPWDDVAYGVSQLYSHARRARNNARKSKKWFHAWRKRSKELGYALDFVARQAGPRAAAIHTEMTSLTDTLGPAVDLIMVRDFVRTHGQGLSSDHVDHLRDAIDDALDDLMKEGRKAGRDSFELKPAKFQKRLSKAVKRDLTPPDEDRTDGRPG